MLLFIYFYSFTVTSLAKPVQQSYGIWFVDMALKINNGIFLICRPALHWTIFSCSNPLKAVIEPHLIASCGSQYLRR